MTDHDPLRPHRDAQDVQRELDRREQERRQAEPEQKP